VPPKLQNGCQYPDTSLVTGGSRLLQKKLVVESHYRVIGSRLGHGAWWRIRAVRVSEKQFPSVVGCRQLIEVESAEIVHKITLDLSTKYIYFGAENIK
jgi:hypothetical protein